MNDNLEQQLQNIADKVQPDVSWFSGAKGDLLSKIAQLPPGSVEFVASSAVGITVTNAILAALGVATAVGVGATIYFSNDIPEQTEESQGATVIESIPTEADESATSEDEASPALPKKNESSKSQSIIPAVTGADTRIESVMDEEEAVAESEEEESESEKDGNGLRVGTVEETPNESLLPWGKREKVEGEEESTEQSTQSTQETKPTRTR